MKMNKIMAAALTLTLLTPAISKASEPVIDLEKEKAELILTIDDYNFKDESLKQEYIKRINEAEGLADIQDISLEMYNRSLVNEDNTNNTSETETPSVEDEEPAEQPTETETPVENEKPSEQPTENETETTPQLSKVDKWIQEKGYEGKTLDEMKEAEIAKLNAHEGLTDEAKKDGIELVKQAVTPEDLMDKILGFNPQDAKTYPTIKTEHKYNKTDNGSTVVIDGTTYYLDEKGDFKGGFKDVASAKTSRSQYNALYAKFVEHYERFSPEKQAEWDLKIKNVKGKSANEILALHKELNKAIVETDPSTKEAIAKSDEFLNSVEKQIAETKTQPTNKQKTVKPVLKESEKTKTSNKTGNREAGKNAKTGIGSMSAVIATLAAASATLKRSKKED